MALGKDGRVVTTKQGDICLRCGDRVDVYDPSVEEVTKLLDRKT